MLSSWWDCFLIWGSAFVIPPVLVGFGIWVVHLCLAMQQVVLVASVLPSYCWDCCWEQFCKSLSLIFSELMTSGTFSNKCICCWLILY